ncbi:RHS repeat-associated core domain-containing protein [Asanoa sp. WMMD1127]|uniref:RHS repeat domain-containing protein n=1 Tax=Asanoa sp. WMMD1127 TaxID=3016107 RepID=UPI002415AF5C|nr:RHS repeat-associated core domain-containing protein [Asanoa sp. WMMD1127]MDG4825040.1 RHS repeat-associated core domain-containing protein [Asanoa sp. WMMD1127]
MDLPPPDARASGDAERTRVAGLPAWVDSADVRRVRVRSFDRKATAAAKVDGVLLAVSRSDGGNAAGVATVTVGYGDFRWAYGGDWAGRLRMRVLPGCAATTPDAPACAGHDVASHHDWRAGTITASVPLPEAAAGVLVAVTAGSESPAGDYKATSLAPATTWTAGGNSGDFSWTYPLRTPPGAGGPVPTMDFAYSSSGVDGRMVAANNQASWLGEGFEWSPGHIERRYTTCAEDMGKAPDGSAANNTTKTGDQCWDTDNATLSLGSRSGELIKDGSDGNRWHLRNDDGTYVERRTGGSSGDDNGEWWVVTTPDGTQHWFGGKPGRDSTLVSPVHGNHKNEPCYDSSSFASSSCSQGWRWQLDHVVDRHGNTMDLFYAKETNKYGKNGSTTKPISYDRAGQLTRIDYGTRTGSTGSAPMQVLFTPADRCLSDCTMKDAVHWPDVPWDQECTGTTCDSTAPTYWSTKRLREVKTQVWDRAAARYRAVESWTLTHSFPDPVDSQPGGLWLEKISHRGLVGDAASVPDITFVGEARANRVDTFGDQYPAMKRFRMKTINTESGGKLDITYSDPDCVKGSRVPDKDNVHANVLRCYPVKWTPAGHDKPIDDFFHKYVVTDVVEADLSGSSSRVRTHYDYVGDPAWHYTDDDGLVDKRYKTWSTWRGYGTVRVTKGDPGEQTRTESRYFRGMHGDKLPSGTRTATMPAISIGGIPAVADEDAYAGMLREEITYNGPDGAEVSAEVFEPWRSGPTASRTVNDFTVHARFTGTVAAHTRTALDGGRAPRTTTVRTTFDPYGMPSKVDDRGDNAVTDDQRCTMTDYARNTALSVWILDRVSRERVFAVDCARAAQSGLTDDDIVEDEKTSYDQAAWGTAPTRGLLSKVETIKAWNGGSPTYLTAERATHDANGRVDGSWDIRGNLTDTDYTPATGGPVTAVTETRKGTAASPLTWVDTKVVEPAWQLPLTTTDPNGRKIDYAYDGLGRLTKVWFPGRDRAQSANLAFDYLVRTDGPLVVTTKRLNAAGGYATSYEFFDNLVRARQTQQADGAGGPSSVVTETFYDSAGRETKTHGSYLACRRVSATRCDPVPPSTTLFQPSDVIPTVIETRFDGAGREIAETHKVDAPPASPGGTVKRQTVTSYGGDRTHVTEPTGGVNSSTITDADGSVVERRLYHSGVAVGSAAGYDRTTYQYDRKGQLQRLTDPTDAVWTYGYDLLGRQIRMVDPDKGTIETTFTEYGDVETTKDGRGATVAYTYDSQGRKATLRDGSTTGAKRAEWVYDTLSNGESVKGHLVKAIRYVGAAQYVKEHVGYTADYLPTSVRHTIPDTEAGLAGSYNYVYTYNQDGTVATVRLPAMGNLATETLTRGYDSQGEPTTLGTSMGATYVTGTDYTSFSEVGAIHLRNNGGQLADIRRTYETHTRRLAQIWTTKQQSPTTVADVRLSYDLAGNVEKVADLASGDSQCFTVDHARQLREAWTPASGDCAAAPTAAGLGGPAKYWHSYRHDGAGNRTSVTEHATAAGDRTTTYTVTPRTHRLTGTSAADNSGTKAASYGHDQSGNMTSRPTAAAGTQTLTWDAEGRLATSQDTSGTTAYVYDAEGQRLIRRDPTGKTLYLPDQELRYTTSTKAQTCTRYYTHADQVVATRTVGGVTWLSGDHHGTAQISIGAVNQSVATRRETPFGAPRTGTGAWPAATDKGFVGGTRDNTGLTHLGAREYDPSIGRFVSVDPVIDVQDPQQMNGYSYAANAPLTASDADGLWPKWMKNVANNVGEGLKKNAGLISSVAGVAALACVAIPPLTAAAPVLAAVSLVAGAVDTYSSCKDGKRLDCGLGIAGVIPGGRALKAGVSGGKALYKGYKAAKGAEEAASLIKTNKALKGTPGFKDMDRALRREYRDANEAAAHYRQQANTQLNPWSKSGVADHRGWNWYERVVLSENVVWEGYKLGRYDKYNYGESSRHGRGGHGRSSWGITAKHSPHPGKKASKGANTKGGEKAGTSGASYWRGI